MIPLRNERLAEPVRVERRSRSEISHDGKMLWRKAGRRNEKLSIWMVHPRALRFVACLRSTGSLQKEKSAHAGTGDVMRCFFDCNNARQIGH